MNGFDNGAIAHRRDGGFDMGNHVGQVGLTGFGQMHLIADPFQLALPTHDAHGSALTCFTSGLRAHFVRAAWVGFMSLLSDMMTAMRSFSAAQTICLPLQSNVMGLNHEMLLRLLFTARS
jgi:hypothetical protein